MRDRWLPAAAVLALLLRLPFALTGLSTDEAGYAYVAQQWSRGAALYTTAWLDRPQGLLVTYRALLAVDDSGWTIRVGMALAGAIITVALGVIARELAGRAAGLTAAFGYAVIGVAPLLEGMTLNGELLAGVPSTVAVALAVVWWRRDRSLWWLAGAGLFAGVALTMKQSGIDGFVVGLIIVLLAAGPRLRNGAVLIGAGLIPLAACVLHGIAIGWPAYWNALLGYQLTALGDGTATTGGRWAEFTGQLGQVAINLAAVLVLSLFGWRVLDRGGRWVAGAWLFAGFVGVNLGGSYWPHYYMQPLPVLLLLAAAALVTVPRAPARRALATALTVPTLLWLAVLPLMSPGLRARSIPYAAQAERDDRIAAVIRASTGPADRIYVLESEAYLYFAAQRVSPYPYLWGKPIDKIPDALPRLRAMLTSPQRPALVVLDTPPAAVDPTGGIAAALAAHYHQETVVDGMPILRAN